MRRICDDLWETAPEGSDDGPTTHAYLWTGSGPGNVLFYNVGTDAELDAIEDLGGVAHQYLSHQDEITPMLATFADRYGTVLHSSAREVHLVEEVRPVDVAFDDRYTDGNGVEVVPTPGHTPGSACFLVRGREGRYLFTGDTLLVGGDGGWFAGYIPGHSDRDQLLASLDVIGSFEPDLVVSSAFAGDAGAHRLDRPWADCVAEAATALAQAGVG